MIAAISADSRVREGIELCVDALRSVVDQELEPALNRRMYELGEHKATLTDDERQELTALVELWERRLAERLQAKVALRRLAELFPDMVDVGTA